MNKLVIESKTFINEFHQYTKNGENKSPLTILSLFHQQFGVTPNVCAILWLKLKQNRPFDFKHKHLLWTLYFLRHYPTQKVMKSWTGCCKVTISKVIWPIIDKLSQLKIASKKMLSIYLIFNLNNILYFIDQME